VVAPSFPLDHRPAGGVIGGTVPDVARGVGAGATLSIVSGDLAT
jgi:hypothetical protein